MKYINDVYIKIFSSRFTGQISNKVNTNLFWVKGNQVFTNEGPRPFPRITQSISTNIGTIKHPLVRRNSRILK